MFRAILKRANLETEAGLNQSADTSAATALAEEPQSPTIRPGEGDPDEVREAIIAVMKTIHDPEIPVNIHDLGLIYDVAVNAEGDAHIRMTLTSPNCPEAQSLPGAVQKGAESVGGVRAAQVDVVWDPPWDQSKMTEAARLKLNMF
jgi:FeS assembly SUF system protein